MRYFADGLWELELKLTAMESLECETEEDFIAVMHAIADAVREKAGLATAGEDDADEFRSFMWKVQHDIDHAIWKRYTQKNKSRKRRASS